MWRQRLAVSARGTSRILTEILLYYYRYLCLDREETNCDPARSPPHRAPPINKNMRVTAILGISSAS